jgi:hypothetical protein
MAPNGYLARIKSVFILTRDLPYDPDDFITTREICSKAEDTCGYATVEGALRIGGLWRVYPNTQAARMHATFGKRSVHSEHIKQGKNATQEKTTSRKYQYFDGVSICVV